MEAATELQHVGGHWQLRKGERLLLCSAVKAEDVSQGDFCTGRDSPYDAAVTWYEKAS
jgi:hypothetical protein